MASKLEVPIFTDTNLGTRIALSVPPDIAARDFKRQLETVHLKCFPESGEIEVDRLMVKRKACYYHLTDSIPVKHAFEGVRGTWFLHVKARASSKCFEPCLLNPETEDSDPVSDDSGITDPLEPTDFVTSTETSDKKELPGHKPSLEESRRLFYVSKRKRKYKRERKKCVLGYKASRDEKEFLCAGSKKVALRANSSSGYQQAKRSVTEVPSEMFSEAKSVTSIIRRYFPNSNEKAGFSSPSSSEATSTRKKTERGYNCSSIKVKSLPKFADRSPWSLLLSPSPSNPAEKTFKSRINGAEVGDRLVTAANNLSLFSSKKKSAIHPCRKFWCGKAGSLIKLSVFDISDSDD